MSGRIRLLLALLLCTLFTAGEVQARKFTIRIIDPESKIAVEDVPVQVMVDDDQYQLISDARGEIDIDISDEEGPQYGIRVTASPQGYIPTSVSWKRRELENLPEKYTLELKRGFSIGGTIQAENGKRIKGAKVIVSITPARGSKERTFISNEEVRSNSDGQWRFHAAPENIESVRLRLEHPYYITNQYYDYGRGKDRKIGPLKTQGDVIVLKPSLSLEGKVLDETGQPVKGAKISTGGNAWTRGRKPSAISDTGGAFAFRDLEPSEMTLSVQAEGFAPTTQKVKVDEDSSPVTIHLEPAATITGVVVDKDGAPIADVSVYASGWGGGENRWRSATDQEGRFEWNSAPHSEVNFSFSKQGHQRISKNLAPSEEEHRITLGIPLTVSGTVEDAATGEPIPSFNVLRGIQWEHSNNRTHWERHNIVTGSGGAYSITFEQSYPKHLVRIEAEGYLPGISRAFTNGEGEQTFAFQLKKGTGPKGLVVSPEGQPLQGVEVVLCTPSNGAYIRNGKNERNQGAEVARTNEMGQFSFTPQVDPFTIVALHDLGMAEAPEGVFARNKKIKLRPWGKVVGTLRIGSATGADQRVNLNIHQEYQRDAPRFYYDYRTTTDDSGRFTFEKVRPGEVTVAREIILREVDGGHQSTHANSCNVLVKPGTTVVVNLGGSGRAVVGKVVFPATAEKKVAFGHGHQSLSLNLPGPFTEEEMAKLNPEERQKKYQEWRKSDAGKAHRRARRNYGFKLNSDGAFHIDDVESGSYTLHISAQTPPPSQDEWRGEHVGSVRHEFVVPEMPEGGKDEPLDLGVLKLVVPENKQQ